jgi:hypothetical protein
MANRPVNQPLNEPLLPVKNELALVMVKQPSIIPHEKDEVLVLPIPREESNGCIVCFSA